jgi:hypothetical protein
LWLLRSDDGGCGCSCSCSLVRCCLSLLLWTQQTNARTCHNPSVCYWGILKPMCSSN